MTTTARVNVAFSRASSTTRNYVSVARTRFIYPETFKDQARQQLNAGHDIYFPTSRLWWQQGIGGLAKADTSVKKTVGSEWYKREIGVMPATISGVMLHGFLRKLPLIGSLASSSLIFLTKDSIALCFMPMAVTWFMVGCIAVSDSSFVKQSEKAAYADHGFRKSFATAFAEAWTKCMRSTKIGGMNGFLGDYPIDAKTDSALKRLGLDGRPLSEITLPELNRAFRRKGMLCHPDVNGSIKEFKMLNAAFLHIKSKIN